MSKVEKMYENAGIKPTHYDACALEDKYWNNEELANQYGTFDGYLSFECPHHGEGCYLTCEYAYDKDDYPPFTAEKQIELIKWLVHYIKQINITDAISGEFYFTAFGCIGDMKIDFEEALASLVNNLWQDLTEEEKQEIKEILE